MPSKYDPETRAEVVRLMLDQRRATTPAQMLKISSLRRGVGRRARMVRDWRLGLVCSRINWQAAAGLWPQAVSQWRSRVPSPWPDVRTRQHTTLDFWTDGTTYNVTT